MSTFLQAALALAIVIAASKAAGALSKKLGQPAVLGELLAGLLLGPTLINLLHFFPDSEHVHVVVKDLAELGVVFLMFMAGLETDLKEMRKVGVAALLGATGGVFLPLAAGLGISMAFGYSFFESLFIGTILTATSVSISAQTLLEMGQLRSKEGMTTLGAAVIDDVMGIVVLSVVVAVHAAQGGAGGGTPVWQVLVQMVGFFAVAIAAGKWVVPPILKAVRKWPGEEVPFAFAIVLGLLFAVGAEVFGKVAAITGSYTLGVMIAQNHDLKHLLEEKFKVLAYGFLVPIFFVSIGLEGDLVAAMKGSGIAYMSLIVAAAIVTKIIGSGLGVKLVGFTWPESLRVGVGMISRGEVALIVAGIGLAAGVIDQGIFSVMIVMTLATTLITPLLLRVVFKKNEAAADK
jgi:Kef-type K+ transport system membrane component KefB